MYISEYVCKTFLKELAITMGKQTPEKLLQLLTFLKRLLLSFCNNLKTSIS